METSSIEKGQTYITRGGYRVVITDHQPQGGNRFPFTGQLYMDDVTGPVASDCVEFNARGERDMKTKTATDPFGLVSHWRGGNKRLTPKEFATVASHLVVGWMVGKSAQGEPRGCVKFNSLCIPFSMALEFSLMAGEEAVTLHCYTPAYRELAERIADHFRWRIIHNELMIAIAGAVNEPRNRQVWTWDGSKYFTELKTISAENYAEASIADSWIDNLTFTAAEV